MKIYLLNYFNSKIKHKTIILQVPKREIFLTELIILSYHIWTGDLGTKAKIDLYEM
jgi:hypothetical protein